MCTAAQPEEGKEVGGTAPTGDIVGPDLPERQGEDVSKTMFKAIRGWVNG